MTTFNVLSRHQNIHQHYLLEASAGTGKTFSIEHIVVRLLLEKDPLSLDQILIVTFTKAATRDLKMRVRETIARSLECLQGRVHHKLIPDYLCAVIEQGNEAVLHGKKRLENALLCFEQAQIYTIHGFCLKMLSNDFSLTEDPIPPLEVIRLLRDFFRTELTSERLSKMQLKILLNKHQHSIDKFEKSLLSLLFNGREIEPLPSYTEQLALLNDKRKHLQQTGLCADKIMADFYVLAPHYKGLCDRSRKIKPAIVSRVEKFALLFDKNHWDADDYEWLIEDQLFFLSLFDDKNKTAKGKNIEELQLHFPYLLEGLKEALSPFVHYLFFFAKLGGDCQKKLKYCLREMERYRYDDLLKLMLEALSNQGFIHQIRQLFRAAIIDEFQDTDPFQWEIFRKLFLEHGNLYLVGDPKQSIYAFRQADIYTYLNAKKALGKNHRASLTVNYRSQPSLINALNVLFSQEVTPELMALPRLHATLPIPMVQPSPNAKEFPFKDDKGCIHISLIQQENPLEQVEKKDVYPFIIQEIQHLVHYDGLRYHQCVVLVSDRYQAEKVARSLNEYNVPTVIQRRSSLTETWAFQSLYEIIQAVLNPKDLSAVKVSLGGKILGWTHEHILTLEDDVVYADIMKIFFHLHHILNKEGFASFFYELMQSTWRDLQHNCAESIMMQEGGIEFYQDLTHLAELITAHQTETMCSPDNLLTYLDSYTLLEGNDDPGIYRRTGIEQDAVSIMTLHSSKGLEFDVVFLIGAFKRTKQPSLLVPTAAGNLLPVVDTNDPRYDNYCEECDAEKMRQFYVAMTRAKNRIYLPVVCNETPPEKGSASLVELFFARFMQPKTDNGGLYKRIPLLSMENLCGKLAQVAKQAHITFSALHSPYHCHKNNEIKQRPILNAPKKVIIPKSLRLVSSFTSLANKEEIIRAEQAPRDYSIESKNPHTLPSGSDTGILFHHLFEILPLTQAKMWNNKEDYFSYVENTLQGSAFQSWEEVFCEVLYNTWHVPFNTPYASFSLKDIDPHHCYREMEFLYAHSKETYFKGFIDLLFLHEDRYYVLDWKSNWLGADENSYHKNKLKLAMEQNDYELQGKIYTQALRKYLKIMAPHKSFHEIFGGVLFVFIRGVDPNHPEKGVYYLQSDELDLLEREKECFIGHS